jgi:hypothetical protein
LIAILLETEPSLSSKKPPPKVFIPAPLFCCMTQVMTYLNLKGKVEGKIRFVLFDETSYNLVY